MQRKRSVTQDTSSTASINDAPSPEKEKKKKKKRKKTEDDGEEITQASSEATADTLTEGATTDGEQVN